MDSTPLKLFVYAGFVLLCGLVLTSCSGRRPADSSLPAQTNDMAEPDTSIAALASTIEVVANPSVDAPIRVVNYDKRNFKEPVSSYDIQHTTLALSFDFQNERVIGSATHRLTSSVQLLTHLLFDAKDMEIQKVSIKRPNSDFQPVPFLYNNSDLTVSLQPGIGKTVALEVRIEYIAHPMKNGQKMGMVFVDGKGDDPSRPTQIWTLGQPEDNQFWFPTWDYPNDRMTFDLSLTVPQQFSTVANGDLLEQKALPGNMRRDRWVLNQPHASYLEGFAIGEFTAVIENYTRRDGTIVPLAYLVEPEYAEHATLIFGETPDIMRFFERNLGIPYPWTNYKQVCVREFTARGMENTTATVMYDKLQHDERAHLDYTGRTLIVHEMAHQWFGNLVTSRNWANLALNEGFASYFERVYLEQAHGLAAAQEHTIEDRNAYLEQAKTLRRPIIWHGYTDPYDMFDQHTYEKAALVLHQLRFELGDDVWWRGVRQYLAKNVYSEVVVEDLQLAMEQASGKGLGGFFQQWYRRPGHPELEVMHNFRADHGIYEVRVLQAQDSLNVGTFAFSVDIEVNVPGAEAWVARYKVTSQDTTFRFAIAGDISFVRFDAGDWLPGDLRVTKSLTEWQNQARFDDEPAGRFDAVRALQDFEPQVSIRNVLLHVLQSDNAAFVRAAAAEALAKYTSQAEARPFLLNAAKGDLDAGVRRRALSTLAGLKDEYLQEGLGAGISDASYEVTAEAVRIYADVYPLEAIQKMRPLYEIQSWDHAVEKAIVAAYAKINAIEGIPYLKAHLHPENDEALQLISLEALSGIARYNPDVRSSIAQFIVGKLDSTREPIRLTTIQALEPILDESIVAILNTHLQAETSDRVRQLIFNIVNRTN